MAAWPVDTLFVVYCAGPHCNGADRAALKLAMLGRPVKLMKGGIAGWKAQGLPFATGAWPGSWRPYQRLARSELPIDTAALARFLIGKVVVRETADGVLSGVVVETEAYIVGDAAGHAYRGMTPRTRSLFLEPGHAYIYLAYGTSYMLNVSSEAAGIGAGVLIRALEPLEGVEAMQRNRGPSGWAT
jgi:hypothetical protein